MFFSSLLYIFLFIPSFVLCSFHYFCNAISVFSFFLRSVTKRQREMFHENKERIFDVSIDRNFCVHWNHLNASIRCRFTAIRMDCVNVGSGRNFLFEFCRKKKLKTTRIRNWFLYICRRDRWTMHFATANIETFSALRSNAIYNFLRSLINLFSCECIDRNAKLNWK